MSSSKALYPLKKELSENKGILTATNYGHGILMNAHQGLPSHLISQAEDIESIVLLSSDAMVNQCIAEDSELLWDLIDTQQESLCIRTKATSYLSNHTPNDDSTADFVFLNEGMLYQLLKLYNKPLLFLKLSKQDYEHLSSIKGDNFICINESVALKEKEIQLKRMLLSQNGEIKILN